MSRSQLSGADRTKLAKLLGLLGSDHACERDADGVAAHRMVHRACASWRQMLNPPPSDKPLPELRTWRQTWATLAARPGALLPWEPGFVAHLPKFRRVGVKRRYILNEVSDRVLGRRTA